MYICRNCIESWEPKTPFWNRILQNVKHPPLSPLCTLISESPWAWTTGTSCLPVGWRQHVPLQPEDQVPPHYTLETDPRTTGNVSSSVFKQLTKELLTNNRLSQTYHFTLQSLVRKWQKIGGENGHFRKKKKKNKGVKGVCVFAVNCLITKEQRTKIRYNHLEKPKFILINPWLWKNYFELQSWVTKFVLPKLLLCNQLIS